MNSKIDLFQNLIKHIGQLAFFLLLISFGSQAQYFNLGAMWQGPKLVFSVSPSATANAGSPLIVSPSVSVTNLKGITINSSSALITLSAFKDDRCSVAAPGVLSATSLSVSAASGTASFSSVSYSADGTIYLKGKAPGIRPACSSAIVVSSGVSATALKQIRNNPIGSSPYWTKASPTRLFFRATSPGDPYSSYPWVSDGTAGGTQILSSLLTFPDEPAYLTTLGAYDYFIVDYKLWRTDWTEAGTINLNIDAPTNFSTGPSFISHNGNLTWLKSGAYPDYYLNSTDGTLVGTTSFLLPTSIGTSPALLGSTASGITIGGRDAQGPNVQVCDEAASCTVLVSNIGNNASSITRVFVSGEKSFFSMHYSGNGYRLWVTDGTGTGTFALNNSWMMNGSLNYVGKIGASELFVGQPTAAGGGTYRIYSSDGVSTSPNKWVLLGDTTLYLFTASYRLDFAAPVNSGYALRFQNNNNATDTVGNVLWFTDGTVVGTSLVGTSFGAADHLTLQPTYPASFGGKVYYPVYSNATGHEMWVYDGISSPTILADKVAGPGDLFSPLSSYVSKTKPASLSLGFIFTALSSTNGQELWISDGTAGGTQVIPGVTPKLRAEETFTILGGKAYFSASDSVNGEEPWVSDGTLAGTHVLKYINPEIGSAEIDYMTKLGSKIIFTAEDGINGNELWATDGTTIGTTMVKRLGIGNIGANPFELTIYNGKIYFGATPTGDYEAKFLYESDGTSSGTLVVKAIPTRNGDGLLENLMAASDGLYFLGTTTANGMEPWKSDGTTAGTNFIDATLGANSTFDYYADLFTVLGSKIIFSHTRDYNNYSPWVSDGTLGGTSKLSAVNADNGGIYPGYGGVNAGSNVFFSADDPTNGRELWVTDGTPIGTNLITNINILGDSDPDLFIALGSQILFAADDGLSGSELWVSDGSAGGTSLLKDISLGVSGTNFGNFVIDGGNAYFFASTGTGWDLWTTNGTSLGTTLITQISASSTNRPNSLMAYNGNLYFKNWDAAHGWEMWKSDKTALGTALHKDLYAGTASSHPNQMTEMGGKLYCSANVGMGWQLFKVDP